MGALEIGRIAAQDDATQSELLKLNNLHTRETSLLTREEWQALVGLGCHTICAHGSAGFLIAIDQDAEYDSFNFKWFQERSSRFVYVDRIVVSADHRGMGIARSLYDNLFGYAHATGHDRIVCEVNRVPPNPGSDQFHASMGFAELGQATLPDNGKRVRYLEKRL